MNIIDTPIKDLKIIEPVVHGDTRGHFFESYNMENFKKAGLDYNFIQDNQSKSTYGVLRGLHFQKAPYAQTKLVRAINGLILDVAVDLRPESVTYKQWFSVELSEDNFKQLLIPQGFAHGFVVLSPEAIVQYKCDNFYNPQSEAGIRYDDPFLNIDWKIDKKDVRVSKKDELLPYI